MTSLPPAPGVSSRKRLNGALIACLVIAIFGVVAMAHQLRQVTLAKEAIHGDASRQAMSSKVAVDMLTCRRFEKDVFLNLHDESRKSAYLRKWHESWDTLARDSQLLRDQHGRDGDPRYESLVPARLEAYRDHFLGVVNEVNARRIAPTKHSDAPSPENANLAMEPFKDGVRFLSEATISLADENTLRSAAAGESLISRAMLGVVVVSLLTVVPGVLIVVVFRRYNADLLAANRQLRQYAQELAIQEEQEREARHSELRAKVAFERASLFDRLTDLPNRGFLIELLQESMRRHRELPGRSYAVLFLDFDRFKLVNDTLGHDVGDQLLVEIAARLRRLLRCTDSIARAEPGTRAARMGGDEFVVLLDDLDGVAAATLVAERLLNEFTGPISLGKHEVSSTASIGLVMGCERYDRADDLLRDADTAMYEAKRAGRGRHVVFDESMRLNVVRRAMLENDLRKAIATDQLSLVYQPIVCLSTGKLHGVEALLRWRHPSEGMIGPAEFIPIAEESQLILELGEWVLREGCRQFADWTRRLGESAPPLVSINVSRKQFACPDLPALVQRVIEEHQLDPSRVQLEITEDAFSTNVKAAIDMTRTIKNTGVKLAIDDFGTGCSSYASLQQFPIDTLKIDRSLMIGIENNRDAAALVHSLAVLVKNLGIVMVSEGIEEHPQVISLQELGCQLGQGYFFARPLSVAELEEFIERGNSTEHCVAGAETFANRWEDRLASFHPLHAD